MFLNPNWLSFWSLNNISSHRYHLVSPFSPSTLFLDAFVLHIRSGTSNECDQECTGSSWVEGHWKPCIWDYCVFCDCWTVLDLDGVLLLWLLCISCLSICDILPNILFLMITIPVLFYVFTNRCNLVLIHNSPLSALVLPVAWGTAISWGWDSTFIVGVDVGTGGIDQLFSGLK